MNFILPTLRLTGGKGQRFFRTFARALMCIAPMFAVQVAHAAETVTYYYSDHQGTVLATANASGALTATSDYRPYGMQTLGSPSDGPGYTGHVNDVDSSLVYMQARYYDPAMGRFLGTDPVGPAAGDVFGFSRYAYTDNNPNSRSDPDGRESPCISVNTDCLGQDQQSRQSSAAISNLAASGIHSLNENVIYPLIPAGPELGLAGEALAGLLTVPLEGAEVAAAGSSLGGEVPVAQGFKAIGSTGTVGENALKTLGGESQVRFSTSTGTRVVDQLVDNVAHESKVGSTSLTQSVTGQIAKDSELVRTGQIDGAVWHFFNSPVTGRGGPSAPLMMKLQDNNIGVVVH